ncbi:MAG TPA: hypothetical protein VEV84_15965 [Pyrinomonadaceae bacterium]|nr:hypothetical protein [Pyrinomonadaceae bacterium]
MKLGLISAFILAAAIGVAAQSARVKPSPTPTVNPNLRPSVIFVPTAKTDSSSSNSRPRTVASPTPLPKLGDEAQVVKVESTLVPIPVSVIDPSGRAVTNLKIDDFQLKIDGKEAEISQIFRSESPVRLAMLFDNSSSVAVAREFEKEAAVKFFRRVVRPDRDQAALFSVADRTELEQPMTHDVSMLVRAIESFPPPSARPPFWTASLRSAITSKMSMVVVYSLLSRMAKTPLAISTRR